MWTTQTREGRTLAGAHTPSERRSSPPWWRCIGACACASSWLLRLPVGAAHRSLGGWSGVAGRCCGAPPQVFDTSEWVVHGAARGGLREAHLPTQQPSPCQEARLPRPDEHPRRSGRAEGPPRQGPSPPVGLIWRIRERSAFARLAADGQRARAGVLWCTVLLDPPGTSTPPRVAYALGRALGPAVVRNRVRRRLRAGLAVASSDGRLPAGYYLFGAQPSAATRSFSELMFDLSTLLARLPRPVEAG